MRILIRHLFVDQAVVEGLSIISQDEEFDGYPINRIG